MVDKLNKEIELTRRNRGNLSEALVGGLNNDLSEFVCEYISNNLQSRYQEYLSDRSIIVFEADLNTYTWMDSEEIDVDPSVRWRPDLIAVGQFALDRGSKERKLAMDRLENPDFEDPPVVNSDKWGQMIRVYYPIEVKSGEKVTLTEQQSDAIPKVVKSSRYARPLLAVVNITELPERFEVTIQAFEDSSFSGGRFET
ncbi:hypothetical protein PM022_19065 [Halorubrum ezzemoulense]|uniref:hypothetical protein n=1 Tax=Halorubrum ezzemoulense TaxID=337243 RepID=UPI00232B5FD5|nr:hypothetical protein [Halorubrum ezzemoulense]MDB2276580.1 hypothetical protein [Halorubrum ezzemoulense]